ncbi:hypothetical protein [Arthrobacter sp. N199823]|uniref:hypothetical protein n=1 Tax=Arthrobacter sp. N199823 TaxID=2058895 RepID=UPI000CE3C91A|nr:hypothetical protein [Arthrobacter sp. N199823]
MKTAENTAGHTAGHERRAAATVQQRSTEASANEPAWLFTCVALLGIAALSSAAASSLLPGLNGTSDGVSSSGGSGTIVLGVLGVFSAIYGLAALGYGLWALRHGKLLRADIVLLVLSLAAGVHLIGLLMGLWRMPAAERTFDATLATMLALELSATAVLGWQRNAPLRRSGIQGNSPGNAASAEGAAAATTKPRSAAAVVGTLFATSLFVAALTTVGMAASTAGELAVPHSGHSDSGHSDSGHSDHDNNVVPENIQRLKDQGHHH